MEIIRSIQNRIYELRGTRVMPDFNLAARYDAETRVLNQAVKRNSKRFPEDFMFRLTKKEFASIQQQMRSLRQSSSSQTVMIALPQNRTGKYVPYAFTEQGVAMLSGVLNSERAINMNIAIMRAVVEIRRSALLRTDLKQQLKEIQKRLGDHDTQRSQIDDAIEDLPDPPAR